MWLLGFLLFPTVLVASRELTINNYVINIENDVLTSVRTTETSSTELNLSRLGLRSIVNGSFNDGINATALNLANNHLTELPESVFSNLTNLEHLSLVNNSIEHFVNAFVGLGNLKSLNISNNPVEALLPGEFYGLNASVNVFLADTLFDKMSVSVFGTDTTEVQESQNPERIKRWARDNPVRYYSELCIYEGIVKRLETLKWTDSVSSDCQEVWMGYHGMRSVEMNDLNITGLEQGWYRMKFTGDIVIKIFLKSNKIVHVTKELLNDLPFHVIFVDLSENRIEHLESGVIDNRYLNGLNLTSNQLRTIEDGALRNMNITDLILNNNRLGNIQFVKTLPPSIRKLYLMNNNINELPAGSFLNVQNLTHLDLTGNNLTTLQRDSLQGLTSLFELRLLENRITTIETGSFQDLVSLEFLNLRGNRITYMDRTLFSGPRRLVFLDMGSNKLTRLSANSVPLNLLSLLLDFNEIESLEPGCFANMPIVELYLEGNKIKTIPKGTFNGPNWHGITKDHRNEALQGLIYLYNTCFDERSSWLPKIFSIGFKGESILDFSGNPVESLMNGDLFGIQKNVSKWIIFSKGQIRLIQGGLFDDA